jgi:hypothetical protein
LDIHRFPARILAYFSRRGKHTGTLHARQNLTASLHYGILYGFHRLKRITKLKTLQLEKLSKKGKNLSDRLSEEES